MTIEEVAKIKFLLRELEQCEDMLYFIKTKDDNYKKILNHIYKAQEIICEKLKEEGCDD